MPEDLDSGVVKSLALWRGEGQPMREVESHNVVAGAGIDDDRPVACRRGLTLISAESWAAVMRELGRDLPWHTRRANVLVESINLAATIDKTIRIGHVKLRVWGETHPCDLMDKLAPGLKKALVPDCRGGVYGEVLTHGTIQVGDRVATLKSPTISPVEPRQQDHE